MIGQETLDRVRREIGIVELISESVKLTRRGRSHVGLCPFHKEKTPSFHVNAERGFYHCFGCNESGDAIKFVQRIEGVEFIDAVRELARRAGIEIVENGSELERRQQTELRRRQQELYELGNAAAHWFERMLREHPLAGLARSELERRGLTTDAPTGPVADALQAFRIGYAPYAWDGLVQHLREAGLSASAAEKIGIIAPRKSGSGYYDRFRHRLMFAVLDLQGRVIAFSGRALPEPESAVLAEHGLEALHAAGSGEPPAKYLNSPESPIYKKREVVFGLYQARSALRTGEACVVVEGNFDVMSLHARGIKQVVAPLGTAFTTEQAKSIARFSQEVVLLFDGDNAGRRAAQSARDACRTGGLSARVGVLPDGVDPDDLVRRGGAEAITRIVKAARPMLEYLIDTALDAGFTADDAAARAAKVREVTALIASEEDPAVRAMAERHADRIAERLGIADARTFQAVTASVRRALMPAERPTHVPQSPARARSAVRTDQISLDILGALLDFPELLESAEATESASLLEGEPALALDALRHSVGINGVDAEQMLAKLAPSIHSFALARLAAPRHETLEDARTELQGNVEKLRALEFTRHKSSVVSELVRLDRTGNFEEQDNLLRELQEKTRRALDRRGA